MSEFWSNFFTPVESEPFFILPWVRIAFNVILWVSAYFCLNYARKHPANLKLFRGLAIVQFIEYILVVIWYYVVDYMKFPMPLFHCRIAKLLLIFLAVVIPQEKYRHIYAYSVPLAFAGSISSFISPDPGPFHSPHITQVGFYFGHFILIIIAIICLSFDRRLLDKEDLKKGLSLVLFFNVAILAIAQWSGMNYSYMLYPPFLKDVAAQMPYPVYVIIVFLAYFVAYAISFWFVQVLQKIFFRENIRE